MVDDRGSLGTVTYQMKKYVHTDRINVRSCDIILGVDTDSVTWVLIRQEGRIVT